ncbi:MAG: CotH kinase family protein [Gemmataceae bacterium]|nr:CotH kinase family protein [Gemmataceae bacterium]
MTFLLLLLPSAAPATVLPSPTRPSAFFGLGKMWDLHLTIPADEWKRMQPKGGFGTRPGQPPAEGRVRSQFGYEFAYVKARLEIGGKAFDEVGVRFKGNSTYAVTSAILKRPFKIELDRHVKGQHFLGVRKLSLNIHAMDPGACREALAYAVYREAGVPAPRTAFGFVTLTIPGKHDREVLGVYTLIENIDKPFLKERFGTGKGMLLKPENVGPLDHLGDKWESYEKRYRPRTGEPKPREQKRLMEFTKLVQDKDEKRFRAEIGKHLHLDEFLRYLAATSLMSSLDSFMGLPHNYYLYLDPLTDRFMVMPWDLDHSFGSLTMFCTAQQLMDLSVRQPWLGRNPLVERLLKDPVHYAAYLGHIRTLLATGFTAARIKRDAASIVSFLAPSKEKERVAKHKRGDGWNFSPLGMMLGKPPDIGTFAEKRVASVQAQLEGKSKGFVITRGFGQPRPPLPIPLNSIVKALDADKDGKVSKDEARKGAAALFAALDREKKGVLEEKALAAGLEKVLPRQGFFGGPQTVLARQLAQGAVRQAGKAGKVDGPAFRALAERLFAEADAGKAGKIAPKQVEEALRRLLPEARR